MCHLPIADRRDEGRADYPRVFQDAVQFGKRVVDIRQMVGGDLAQAVVHRSREPGRRSS